MARKKKHPEHVNHERWLVSYADFMTLLFAFFVVMFAVSQVDSKKVGRFTESFSKAVGIDLFPSPGTGLLPGGGVPIPQSDAQPMTAGEEAIPKELSEIKTQLNDMKKRSELPGGLNVLQRRNEIVIRLSEHVSFGAGDDNLKPNALDAIRLVARELVARKVDIRIEGHTDNRPIHTARFRSNWDLSTSRASTVVAVLADAGIAPERLSAAGYGEFHPVAVNTTDEGRSQNRRVDIVVSAAALPAQEKEATDAPSPTPAASASASASAPASASASASADSHGTDHATAAPSASHMAPVPSASHSAAPHGAAHEPPPSAPPSEKHGHDEHHGDH